ncbi:MAG TPA: beta-galactosidase [Acidobacteriaceae bacterium]|nr:beta-galactosidase [Acidobacteriaceae bacterium]
MRFFKLAVIAAMVVSPLTFAQATNYANQPPVLLGAAWYPEQWPESRWDADLDLMEAAHIHVVRVGEFAWSTMEPEEGVYHWKWLDDAIADAARRHIAVVLGTPTAAPPAWLTEKYPQTLRISEDGVRDQHGNRQQFSFADEKYRELAHDIAERMAVRYGHNPDVVGWQIDNELSNTSFDPEAKAQFHAWLQKKYGTIANLNAHWHTAYWSQTYNDFDQIPVREDNENPALLLDWMRFVTDTWVSYTENQVSAIRPHADPRQFITTNTMGWFDGFDAYKLHKVLDIAAWDDYIDADHYDPFDNGARDDLTRGFKRKDFWIMETEPAFVNWRRTNTPLEKGQVRDIAWQNIGHGANAVEYWQWRANPNGQEEYHGVLVGIDGKPAPVYAEIQQVGKEFDEAGEALKGTTPHSEVAVIQSYDSRWAINFQRHSADFDPVAELLAFYTPLRVQSQAVDIVSPTAPLDGYKVVVAPALNVLPQAMADHLIAYVKQGGHLVLGPRSGMKDAYDALQPARQPGPLVELLGGSVTQFYALAGKVPVSVVVPVGEDAMSFYNYILGSLQRTNNIANAPVSGEQGAGTANIWAETLQATNPETKVLMRYGASNGWLDGQPAVLERKVGNGSITYVGAWLDPTLLSNLTAMWLKDAGVKPLVDGVPHGVEVCARTGEDKTVLILINHNTTEESVKLPGAMKNLLAGGAEVSSVTLPKYGVAVLEER